MSTPPSTPQRKLPKQKRSQQIVNAIVAAAKKILASEGPNKLNTNYVAEVAGVNIASLYRWFPNKDAIIESAFETLITEEIEELLSILQQQSESNKKDVISLNSAIGFIIDPLIKRQQRFLSLHDCFYKEHQDNFNVGKRSFLDSDQTWIEVASHWLATVIHYHHPDLSEQETEYKAFFITRSIQGLCLSAATDQSSLLEKSYFRNDMLEMAHDIIRRCGTHA